MKGRGLVWLGALCVLASIAGAITLVAGFDRVERHSTVSSPTATWSIDPDGRARRTLGRFSLPAPGVLRAVVCPVPLADPHATLVVTPIGASRGASPRSRTETFTADESRGKRCYDASYRADRGGEIAVDLLVRGPFARTIPTVDVSASRRITPFAMWPVLLMIAGFAIIIAAPREPHRVAGPGLASGPPDSLPEAFMPEHAAAMPLGGIIPPESLTPGRNAPTGSPDGAHVFVVTPSGGEYPDTFADFVLGRPPPVRWPFSPILAVVAYVVLIFAAPILVTLFAALAGGSGAMERGSFIITLMLVQHGMLIAAAFWFLGGLTAADRRDALGLVAVTRASVLRSAGLAFALIAVAVITTQFIKDVSVTPMGQLVERTPVRYAIAFGALLAPFSEELFFRGVLYGAFAKRSAVIGIVGSALIFTASHALQLSGASIGLIPIASVALTNGVLRARSGGISQPWMVHAIYNFVLSVGLYFA